MQKSQLYYVYILWTARRSFYIGFSDNLRERLQKHTKGEVRSTRYRRPVRLLYYEGFINEQDAKAREEFLKSGYGRQQWTKMLQHTLQELGVERVHISE